VDKAGQPSTNSVKTPRQMLQKLNIQYCWPGQRPLGLHLITSLIVSLTPVCDLETAHAFLNANSLIFVDLHMHQDV